MAAQHDTSVPDWLVNALQPQPSHLPGVVVTQSFDPGGSCLETMITVDLEGWHLLQALLEQAWIRTDGSDLAPVGPMPNAATNRVRILRVVR